MDIELPEIGIIILAGGEGKRMGGLDKGWCLYQQQPMIEQILSALEAQYKALYGNDAPLPIFISANRNLVDYEGLGYPVITDKRSGFCGPLAGIESVLSEGKKYFHGVQRWVTYPVDAPEVPADYLQNMSLLSFERFGLWQSDGRLHFANLSLPDGIGLHLSQYLNFGNRSIKGWLLPYSQQTDYITSSVASHQSFLNLNRTADLL